MLQSREKNISPRDSDPGSLTPVRTVTSVGGQLTPGVYHTHTPWRLDATPGVWIRLELNRRVCKFRAGTIRVDDVAVLVPLFGTTSSSLRSLISELQLATVSAILHGNSSADPFLRF